jgi:archaellum component FlaF (FlaF/FlaG flagellin family)
VKKLITKLLRNKKGTAEIIGSVMFIVILLFFFTNVYLWHDAATKEMNDLYVAKLNSPIVVDAYSTSPVTLTVTNNGGIEAKLSMLWVDVRSATESDPDQNHFFIPLNGQVVAAGSSVPIITTIVPTEKTHFTVVTTAGNLASYDYTP